MRQRMRHSFGTGDLLPAVQALEEIKKVAFDYGHWYPHIFLFDAMGMVSEF